MFRPLIGLFFLDRHLLFLFHLYAFLSFPIISFPSVLSRVSSSLYLLSSALTVSPIPNLEAVSDGGCRWLIPPLPFALPFHLFLSLLPSPFLTLFFFYFLPPLAYSLMLIMLSGVEREERFAPPIPSHPIPLELSETTKVSSLITDKTPYLQHKHTHGRSTEEIDLCGFDRDASLHSTFLLSFTSSPCSSISGDGLPGRYHLSQTPGDDPSPTPVPEIHQHSWCLRWRRR